MKLAIIDYFNHDVGLKVLFPEADYFNVEKENNKNDIYNKYAIVDNPIASMDVFKKYDTLFIVTPTFGAIKSYNNKPHDIHEGFHNFLVQLLELIKTHRFITVCFFDNFDYDYDPTIVLNIERFNISDFTDNIVFFKRNYNKNKTYPSNVFPFPYIIFGGNCITDFVIDPIFLKNSVIAKIPRIFFSGSLFNHEDFLYGQFRNRKEIMSKINSKVDIYFTGNLPHKQFMNEMATSKYSLDLLGCGDPNIRTFEILSSGSLRLAQRSPMKWNFNDDFCEETYFDDENDLYSKLVRMESTPGLYDFCLNKQNEIVQKYMNASYLKNEIISKLVLI
jgi:hypothetical protein